MADDLFGGVHSQIIDISVLSRASDALVPDLAQGYYSWGIALTRHGDLVSGLAKQGRWKDALAKYDEALRYAPSGVALKQVRAAAAAAKRS